MKKIFISYSTQDISLAKFIHCYFNNLFQGKAEFFLSDSIEPGKTWLNTVREEVKAADAGLFLLTPMSVYRPWLNIEFGAFWALEKEVYPLIAGDLRINDVHRPLADFEITRLNDESSTARLICQISAFCDMSVPPVYDAAKFCESLRILGTPIVAFSNLKDVSARLSLKQQPIPEILKMTMLDSEPADLLAEVLRNDTLCVSGNFSDSGIINVHFPSSEPIEFLVLEVNNAENIHSCFEGRMAKIVVNHEPIQAFEELQRHPFDPQFIPKQNGFFLFSLTDIHTDQDFTIKIVLWRTRVRHLLFRLYFIRQELMLETIETKMELLTSGTSLRA